MKPILFLLVISITLSAQTFTDVSHKLPKPVEEVRAIPGASAVDFNNDGNVDIYISAYLTKGQLLKNNGNDFEDVIDELGIDDSKGSNFGAWGGTWADINNDSRLDVIFSATDKLYIQNTNGTFTLFNSNSGLILPEENFFSQGVGWLDINKDGYLDIFMGNDFLGDNILFKNINGNSFNNISGTANINTGSGTYGITVTDINNDFYPDIFVTACSPTKQFSVNSLLINNKDETFTNIGAEAGINDSLAAWGVVSLDYDNDSDFDFFITNMWLEESGVEGYNKLYTNNGDNTFTDLAESAGVRGDYEDVSFSTGTADFNNDGWLDIYEVEYNEQDNIYINNHDGTFTNIADSIGFIQSTTSSMALADFNNDGWIDIFVAKKSSIGSKLYYNDGGSNNWIKIKLQGNGSNFFGIGAKINVFAGQLSQIREINSGEGFIQQNNNYIAHFGIADYSVVDSVIVRWPTGTVNKLYYVNADQEILIKEEDGSVTSAESFKDVPINFFLEQNYPNPFNPVTTIKFFIPSVDAYYASTTLRVYDILGNEITTLVSGIRQPGIHEVEFKGENLPSGVYYYTLTSGDFRETKKMLLIK